LVSEESGEQGERDLHAEIGDFSAAIACRVRAPTDPGMMMRFLDTNILLYSNSRDPTELKLDALELIDAAS